MSGLLEAEGAGVELGADAVEQTAAAVLYVVLREFRPDLFEKYSWPSRLYAQRLIDRLEELGVAELCPMAGGKFGRDTRLIRIRIENCPPEYNPDG